MNVLRSILKGSLMGALIMFIWGGSCWLVFRERLPLPLYRCLLDGVPLAVIVGALTVYTLRHKYQTSTLITAAVLGGIFSCLVVMGLLSHMVSKPHGSADTILAFNIPYVIWGLLFTGWTLMQLKHNRYS